jgi:hypothetical protein
MQTGLFHPLATSMLPAPFNATAAVTAASLGVPRSLLFQAKPSCAIISNSGMLIGSGLGKEIDRHDFVWRLNMAPTKGYEKDVGSKTDIRLLNDHGAQWLREGTFPYESNTTHLFDVMVQDDQVSFDSDLSELIKQHPQGRFGVIPLETTDAFNRLMLKEFKLERAVATTGAIAMLTALHVCHKVDLYHMAHTENALKNPYHYWEKGDGYEGANNFHNAFMEQDTLYKQMALEDSLQDFQRTGKLTLEGFSNSNCSNDTSLIESFNDTKLETSSMQQSKIMTEMRKLEVKAMERLACRV